MGGLIGLCLGGSILSIIEFIYHVCEGIFSRSQSKKKKKHVPIIYLSEFNKMSNKGEERNHNVKQAHK